METESESIKGVGGVGGGEEEGDEAGGAGERDGTESESSASVLNKMLTLKEETKNSWRFRSYYRKRRMHKLSAREMRYLTDFQAL